MARILVAEDDVHIARLIDFKLRKDGFEVGVAHDGAEVLRRLRAENWDLLILDLMMPVKDGWQVLRELRAGTRNRDIPVLMLTARGKPAAAQAEGVDWGAFEIFPKPFDPAALSGRVRDWLGERP